MKKIKVGIAGVRGLSTVMGLNALPDVEITALCDLDENVLSEAQIDGDTVRFEIGAHRIAQVKIYR